MRWTLHRSLTSAATAPSISASPPANTDRVFNRNKVKSNLLTVHIAHLLSYYLLIQLYLPLVEIRNLYLNLDQTSISSDKDKSNFVMTCSTFVNPESSITDIHSPPMNASPRIRLYFDILSNEILKKGPAQADRSLCIICQSDIYSSTAACAAANRCWLSTTYRVFVNYWRLFCDTFCTFLHAHGNDKRVFTAEKSLSMSYFLFLVLQ